jgi:hypothetical protein
MEEQLLYFRSGGDWGEQEEDDERVEEEEDSEFDEKELVKPSQLFFSLPHHDGDLDAGITQYMYIHIHVK